MKFNNQTFEEFRSDFSKATKELEEKFGVVIDLGSFRYSEDDFTTKMKVLNKSGEGTTAAEIEWENDAYFFGLKKEDLGRTVKLNDGTPSIIIGLKKRSYKYPVIVETKSGKKYKMSSTEVIKQLR